MPMPLSGLARTLSNSVADVQAQIVDVQNQLASGTKTLNPAENGVVTRLSAQAAAYGTVLTNIQKAQNVIDVDQTALTSISSILTQMKSLATQAASTGLQQTDTDSLNTTFTNLRSQIAAIQAGASVNGNNLLNNTSLIVQTGIDGTSASQTTLAGINVSAITTALSSLTITSPAAPTDAITAYAARIDRGTFANALTSTKVLAAISDGTNKVQFTATAASVSATETAQAFADLINSNTTISSKGYFTVISGSIAALRQSYSSAAVLAGRLSVTAATSGAGTLAIQDDSGTAGTLATNSLVHASVNAVPQSDVITFNAPLASGDTVSIGGLTFTATAATTSDSLATQYAAYIKSSTAGTSGTFSGSFTASFVTGTGTGFATSSGSNLTLTSTSSTGAVSSPSISATISGSTGTAQANAATAITTLTTQLNTVSTAQSVLSAQKSGLLAQTDAANALQTGLTNTVNSIQNIDATAMQAKLQQLNNQQSIDYYLVSQMNTEAAAILSIFR